MKIAIISDLHGNYEALRSLREDTTTFGYWVTLVNYGPEPGAVVDFVKANSSVVVRGNHDHSLGYDVDPRCGARFQKMADVTRRYSASVLKKGPKGIPAPVAARAGIETASTSFYLCHAKASDPLYCYCPEQSKNGEGIRASEGESATRWPYPIPFVRQIGNRAVVNPGSLGQPKNGKSDACYAIWEDGSFSLKSFPYAVDETIGRVRALGFPQEVEKDLITVLQTGSV